VDDDTARKEIRKESCNFNAVMKTMRNYSRFLSLYNENRASIMISGTAVAFFILFLYSVPSLTPMIYIFCYPAAILAVVTMISGDKYTSSMITSFIPFFSIMVFHDVYSIYTWPFFKFIFELPLTVHSIDLILCIVALVVRGKLVSPTLVIAFTVATISVLGTMAIDGQVLWIIYPQYIFLMMIDASMVISISIYMYRKRA